MTHIRHLRELAHRSSIAADVTLAWEPSTNVLTVFCEVRDGASIEIPVRAEDAMLAFHHPFAYSALARLEDEQRSVEPRSHAKTAPVRPTPADSPEGDS
jgi:hypothetical protein